MATLNEHISVLAAILSDISDGSVTNYIYILLASECHNTTTKNTLKQTNHQTKSQFVYKQTLGSRDYSWWDQSFFDLKNESTLAGTSRLVKDRCRQSKSAPSPLSNKHTHRQTLGIDYVPPHLRWRSSLAVFSLTTLRSDTTWIPT